jgi:hypothetical protein
MISVDQCIKGWLVGDFAPSLFTSKDVEVGVKYYKSGDFETRHVHKIITEYTIVLSGKVRMNDRVYGEKEIVTINPNESTDFECIEDAITLVIKTPSIPSDKHICE